MEIALLLVTIVSIATAAAALIVVRRTTAAEQRRSDARVAALAAAVEAHPGDGRHWTYVAGQWRWHPNVGDPRTDDLRDESGRELVLTPAETAVRSVPNDQAPGGREAFFKTVERTHHTPWQFRLAVGAVLFFVAIGAISVLAVRGGRDQTAIPPEAAAAQAHPLELVALGHSHDTHVLVITGTVRNPGTGAQLDELTAVISLLDRTGTVIATRDVPLDYRVLAPGEEAPFTLSVPDEGGIDRYRVSFRAGTAIIPHIDLRGGAKMANRTA